MSSDKSLPASMFSRIAPLTSASDPCSAALPMLATEGLMWPQQSQRTTMMMRARAIVIVHLRADEVMTAHKHSTTLYLLLSQHKQASEASDKDSYCRKVRGGTSVESSVLGRVSTYKNLKFFLRISAPIKNY